MNNDAQVLQRLTARNIINEGNINEVVRLLNAVDNANDKIDQMARKLRDANEELKLLRPLYAEAKRIMKRVQDARQVRKMQRRATQRIFKDDVAQTDGSIRRPPILTAARADEETGA